MRRQLRSVGLWIADLVSDPVEIVVCVKKRHPHTVLRMTRIGIAKLPIVAAVRTR
jgi:hypothetical protein